MFCDIPLKLQGLPDEPFAACALALNIKTNVAELPRPSSRLRATCYPKFGCAGAAVAIVASPSGELRGALQEAVVRGARTSPFAAGRTLGLGRADQSRFLPVQLRRHHRRERGGMDRAGEEPGNHADRLPRRQLVPLRRLPAQSGALSARACQSAGRDRPAARAPESPPDCTPTPSSSRRTARGSRRCPIRDWPATPRLRSPNRSRADGRRADRRRIDARKSPPSPGSSSATASRCGSTTS